VSQVGVAPPALDLDPPHSVTEVLNLGYIVNLITAAAAAGLEGVIEAGPAAARLELVARLKERDFAAQAGVGSLFGVVIDTSTGEGTLRSLLKPSSLKGIYVGSDCLMLLVGGTFDSALGLASPLCHKSFVL